MQEEAVAEPASEGLPPAIPDKDGEKKDDLQTETVNLGATDAVRSAVEDASPTGDSGEIAAVHGEGGQLTSSGKKRMHTTTHCLPSWKQ